MLAFRSLSLSHSLLTLIPIGFYTSRDARDVCMYECGQVSSILARVCVSRLQLPNKN